MYRHDGASYCTIVWERYQALSVDLVILKMLVKDFGFCLQCHCEDIYTRIYTCHCEDIYTRIYTCMRGYRALSVDLVILKTLVKDFGFC